MKPRRRLIEIGHYGPEDECWDWPYGKDRHGYGMVSRSGGSRTHAQRYSYEIHIGPLTRETHVDHECGNPGCWNPNHLRPVSNKTNSEYRTVQHGKNTSGYRGVQWCTTRKKWIGRVRHNYKYIYVGQFTDPKVASEAVRAKRQELGFLEGRSSCA